jgi:hypothetical protein
MASKFEKSDFVDSDYEASRTASSAFVPATVTHTSAGVAISRPPSREELEVKVTDAHTKLAELKRIQEELERERGQLEEARRRRIEYQTGREEMLNHLTRGIELLKEAEFNTKRDAEQMAKSLADMRDAVAKVEALHEESWTQENWNTELTRALTTLENARMEWNSARIKWPVLDGALAPAPPAGKSAASSPLADKTFTELCKLGLALSWPVAVATLIGTGIIAIILFQR